MLFSFGMHCRAWLGIEEELLIDQRIEELDSVKGFFFQKLI